MVSSQCPCLSTLSLWRVAPRKTTPKSRSAEIRGNPIVPCWYFSYLSLWWNFCHRRHSYPLKSKKYFPIINSFSKDGISYIVEKAFLVCAFRNTLFNFRAGHCEYLFCSKFWSIREYGTENKHLPAETIKSVILRTDGSEYAENNSWLIRSLKEITLHIAMLICSLNFELTGNHLYWREFVGTQPKPSTNQVQMIRLSRHLDFGLVGWFRPEVTLGPKSNCLTREPLFKTLSITAQFWRSSVR